LEEGAEVELKLLRRKRTSGCKCD